VTTLVNNHHKFPTTAAIFLVLLRNQHRNRSF